MTALESVRAALTQAASEPPDGLAIRTGVGPDVQFRGVTWAELAEVVAAAEKLAEFRDWLARELRQKEESVVMATSDDASLAAAMQLGALSSVLWRLDGAL